MSSTVSFEIPREILQASRMTAEGERGVLLARQHQQRIGVLLRASVRALARLLRREHDGAHEFMLPLGVRFERGREKRAVGIAVFVALPRRRGWALSAARKCSLGRK